MISVARKMPEFHYDPAKGSFKQWLLLITRRRIQDHLRRLYHSLPTADTTAEELSRRSEEVLALDLAPDAAIDSRSGE